jgi:hypothetical protein
MQLSLVLHPTEYNLPSWEIDINLPFCYGSITILKQETVILRIHQESHPSELFSNSYPTFMILGYALLGLFVYVFGDSKDNSSLNFEKYLSCTILNLSLGLVIPVDLPLRFWSSIVSQA